MVLAAGPDAVLEQATFELLKVTLGEIARHHPGILDRFDINLRNQTDGLADPIAAEPLIMAREVVGKLMV